MLPAGTLKRSVNAETPTPKFYERAGACLCRGSGCPRDSFLRSRRRVSPQGRTAICLYTVARGACRGASPLCVSLVLIPQEWGQGGLIEVLQTAYESCRSPLAKEGYGEGDLVQVGQRRLRQQPVQTGAWRQTVFPCWTSSAWYSLNSASSWGRLSMKRAWKTA